MHAIVPPYLLARLADADAPHLAGAAEAARVEKELLDAL